MRPRAGFIGILLMVTLLAGCATDTVVLLPRADGSTGAIAASRGGKEVLLDSPYASAKSGIGGGLHGGVSDQQKVNKQFGAALGAMPPAPKSYTVYFKTGSDDFTEESTAAVQQMLADMVGRPEPEVTVIGHTDLVGNDADNDVLSRQRAEKVKGMLVDLGIPADRITAVGRGSREPLVPTASGVDEPRNRRVEVSLR